MKNMKKQQLINDVLTGLVVAAAFAAVVPHEAAAQLSTSVTNSGTQVINPFIKIVDYISYGVGTVFGVAGIAGAKKHADQPQNNPLGPALGKLGAGAAFLAAPTALGMLSQTSSATLTGAATFSQIPGVQ